MEGKRKRERGAIHLLTHSLDTGNKTVRARPGHSQETPSGSLHRWQGLTFSSHCLLPPRQHIQWDLELEAEPGLGLGTCLWDMVYAAL